jgi:hypothetical protein
LGTARHARPCSDLHGLSIDDRHTSRATCTIPLPNGLGSCGLGGVSPSSAGPKGGSREAGRTGPVWSRSSRRRLNDLDQADPVRPTEAWTKVGGMAMRQHLSHIRGIDAQYDRVPTWRRSTTCHPAIVDVLTTPQACTCRANGEPCSRGDPGKYRSELRYALAAAVDRHLGRRCGGSHSGTWSICSDSSTFARSRIHAGRCW